MGLLERRLRAEWGVLQALVDRNPASLSGLHAQDTTFCVALSGPIAPCVAKPVIPIAVHDIRILYPVHFPAVPMEVYVAQPVQHPNVHPETGFVCVWQSHRVSHTAEIALHRVAAMLSGALFNAEPLHLMQPEALATMNPSEVPFVLEGVEHPAPHLLESTPFLQIPNRKTRLS